MADNYYTPQIFSQNTPKGVENDSAVIPSAYIVKEFVILNQNGQSADIRNLVTDFNIVEEIFSPIMVLTARIRDNINFFQEFAINGQEIITLSLAKKEGIDPPQNHRPALSINLTFTVKEYPNYEKSTDSIAAQEYTLIAISNYAYLSALQRISRSVHGNTMNNIVDIFKRDLGLPNEDLRPATDQYQCVSQFDGVITIQSPLKAIEWLRKKSFDSKGAPFFVYNTITDNRILMKSWSSMIDDSNRYPDSDFKYKFKPYVSSLPLSQQSYFENMSRILSMRSNIRLDKLAQATAGGFYNTVEITDFGTKTFIEKIFNATDDNTVKNNRLKRSFSNFKFSDWGKAFGFLSGSPQSQHPLNLVKNPENASISEISTVSGSNNASNVYESNLNAVKSYLANIESQTHEITVFGDFALNPGKKIEIEIPKAANIDEYKTNIKPDSGSDFIDTSLSGEYIVAVAVHNFSNGFYTTRAKIIRDNT